VSRVGDVAGALVAAAIGLIGLAFGVSYGVWEGAGPGAGFFPALSGAALAGVGVLIAIRDPAPEPETAAGEGFRLPRQSGYIVGLFAFALLMERLGAIPVIVLLFLWILAGIERLPWRVVLPVTAGAALGAWLLFDVLLRVPLPRGMWG
jgi:putative tricarboxylic transport membrane protein